MSVGWCRTSGQDTRSRVRAIGGLPQCFGNGFRAAPASSPAAAASVPSWWWLRLLYSFAMMPPPSSSSGSKRLPTLLLLMLLFAVFPTATSCNDLTGLMRKLESELNTGRFTCTCTHERGKVSPLDGCLCGVLGGVKGGFSAIHAGGSL